MTLSGKKAIAGLVTGLAVVAIIATTRPAASNVGSLSQILAVKPTKVPSPKTRTTTTTSAKKASAWRVLSVSSNGLKEVSGCAFSRQVANRVWVHNDSGDGPDVVPVDISSGSVGRTVTLQGVDVVDPEDIASTADGDLILADIGDNAVARKSVQLYRFREPALNANSAEAKRIDLRYPDGPHNAEALAVSADGSDAFIFTKEPTGVAAVFRADLTATSEQVMTQIGQVTIKGESGYKANLISAADAVGASVVLRSFQYGYFLPVPSGGNMSDAAKATPVRFIVPQMAQAEALCVSPDGRTLVTASESQGARNFALAVGSTPN